jgi:hypothetical protein
MRILALAIALAAAQAPAIGIAQDAEPVATLRDQALAGDTLAWDLMESLTTEVGPRLAGTESEARARDWAVRTLTDLGFANVRVETFQVPLWVRGEERAEITA